MENVRTDELKINIAPKKAYKTPARMVVLGGVDSLVQTSISPGDDGQGSPSAS